MLDQDRVRQVYVDERGRFRIWGSTSFNQLQPQVAYTETSFREHLYAMLRAQQWAARNLSNSHVLEVGCGWGRNFPIFLDIGILQRNICGIDLLQPFAELARDAYPAAKIRHGDASEVHDFATQFDLILIHTTLSAILDEAVHRQIIKVATSCLAKDGLLVVMDVVESYQDGKVRVRGEDMIFLRAVSKQKLFSYCHAENMTCVADIAFGLAPRLRSGTYSRIGRFIRNPITLRMIADVLSLVLGRRSHYMAAFKKV